MFDRIELHFELLDALRARPPGFLNGGRVVALALGFGNFVAGSTLLAPQALNFWNETSPDRFQGRDVPERLVGIQSTPAQASSYLLKTIPDDGRIEHESSSGRSFGRMRSSHGLAALPGRAPFYIRHAPYSRDPSSSVTMLACVPTPAKPSSQPRG